MPLQAYSYASVSLLPLRDAKELYFPSYCYVLAPDTPLVRHYSLCDFFRCY